MKLSCMAVALVWSVAAPTTAASAQTSTTRTETPAPRIDAAQIESLRSELAAAEPVRRAWAAWKASEANVRELAPDVLAALRSTITSVEGNERKFALLSLLDAAIRLDVRPTVADLTSLSAIGFDAHVLVFTSRAPAEHLSVLELLHEKPSEIVQAAADNLIAASSPSRAVELLLPDARVGVLVRVKDPGQSPEETFKVRGVACGKSRAPNGFPPTVLYELVEGTTNGADVIANGPRPVGVRRAVYKLPWFSTSSAIFRLDRHEHALDLLRWIAGDRADTSTLASVVTIEHGWTNAEAYLTAVGPEIRSRHDAWSTLVDALVTVGALPSDRRPTEPPIDVEVEDVRTDRSVPLPELPR